MAPTEIPANNSKQLQNKEQVYSDSEYANAIAKIIAMTGMAVPIEDYEIGMAIGFLRKHYPPRPHAEKSKVVVYSPEYIATVWEWGIAGYFEMPKPYRMSIAYISEVLINFKTWRMQENAKPKAYKPELKQLPPKSEAESSKSIVIKEFERFKSNKSIVMGCVVYDCLVELGQFDETIWEDYQDEAEKMERIERGERGVRKGDAISLRSLLNGITPQTIKTTAKAMAVEAYFATIDSLEF